MIHHFEHTATLAGKEEKYNIGQIQKKYIFSIYLPLKNVLIRTETRRKLNSTVMLVWIK
jgi:hypothetical protein